MIQCVGIRLLPGGRHPSHIEYIWYNDGGQTRYCTREQMHDFVAAGGQAFVQSPITFQRASLSARSTITPIGEIVRWVETKRDNDPTDNLMFLPRM